MRKPTAKRNDQKGNTQNKSKDQNDAKLVHSLYLKGTGYQYVDIWRLSHFLAGIHQLPPWYQFPLLCTPLPALSSRVCVWLYPHLRSERRTQASEWNHRTALLLVSAEHMT